MTYRLRNIILAVALAAVAAALTSFYVSNFKKSVRDGEENVTVFVASRDIPAGTPGSKAAAMLTPTQVERNTMVTGAITSRDQVSSLIVTERIFKDEQALVRRFKPVEQAGIKAELKANVRAVQIQGDANQLLAGTLKKGDRVDVLGNYKVREGRSSEERHYARTVLRDVLVLRAPQGDFSQGKLEGAVGATGSRASPRRSPSIARSTSSARRRRSATAPARSRAATSASCCMRRAAAGCRATTSPPSASTRGRRSSCSRRSNRRRCSRTPSSPTSPTSCCSRS